MLDEHGTPMRFWADAISTACYVSNRIFLRSILLLTPLSFEGEIEKPSGPLLGLIVMSH
jgi:hypothetical protein